VNRVADWRKAAIVVGALLLLWRIIEVNAVLYDEAGRPRLPAPVEPGVVDSLPGKDALKALLHENPAHAAAYLTLGRVFEQESDMTSASRSYSAAYQVAPADRDVLATDAAFFLSRGRTMEALRLLETAVDHYPDMREVAFPAMARSLVSGREAEEWKSIAARQPAWLGPFIVSSCESGVDPGALIPMFLARVRASRAGGPEAGCLVEHLRAAGRWEAAYQLWLDTLPREKLAALGFVFNGGFEFATSGVGFDWIPDLRLERDSGHTVEFARTGTPEGQRALRVSYNGKRQSGIAMAQYLFLAPGAYEMSGIARPESVRAGHGAQWTVRCVVGGKPDSLLGQSQRFLGTSDWDRFTFTLDVPADCAGEVLQLEAVAGDSGPVFLAGTLWFDNLVVRQYH
jgi:hypothetical protein